MDKCNINWKKILKDRDISSPFKSTKLIKRRIDKITENLQRESWRKRLSHAFISTYVPEFGDDVVARQHFEDTFFESLAEQSYKRTKPQAARRLLEAVGIHDGTTPDEIREALEERLTDPDWYKRKFARSDAEA